MNETMPNPNRKLSAEIVGQLVSTRLPHLAPGLARDRAWLWLCTEGKPCESDRTIMKDLGFGFTPRPHVLPDGRVARWFHAAGGFVARGKHRRATGETTDSDALSALMALAGAE